MDDETGEPRRGTYRRRLAWAAAASLATHLLLFRGLAVSRMGADVDLPSATPAEKRAADSQADFQLQVSASAAAERPAHERPLDVKLEPPAQPREPPTRPADPERIVAARAADDPAAAVEVSPAQVERAERTPDTALAAAAAPERQATVDAGAAPAQADLAAVGPAAAPEQPRAAPVPSAAAEHAAASQPPETVASRWRPREVALLERLTARAPAAVARAPSEALVDAPVPAAAERRTATDVAPAPDASAATIAAPAAAASAAPVALAPAETATARAATAQAATAPRAAPGAEAVETPTAAAVRGAPPVGAVARLRSAIAGTAAPATAVERRRATGPTGPAAATADATAAGPAASAAPAPATPAAAGVALASRGAPAAAAQDRRVAGGTSARAPGAGGEERAAVATGTVSARTVTSGTTAGAGRAVAGPPAANVPAGAPAALDRVTSATTGGPTDAAVAAASPAPVAAAESAGATRPPSVAPGPATLARARGESTARAAVTAVRPGIVPAADEGEDGGLSVAALDAAAVGALNAARRGAPPEVAALSEARRLERVAAVALPAETRVRDVAEAFARRAAATRDRAGARAEEGSRTIGDRAVLDRADALVDRGLEFLARSQQPDGRWSLGRFSGATPQNVPRLESETAATGLALLAFFGAGYDHFEGRHRDTVRKGIEYLLAVQKPDGDLYVPADELSNSCAWLYSHGIASIALCEAVGMTGDPLVRPAAEKACGFIAATQHPQLGGWRYTPRSDADLSVSGWMLVAARSAELAGMRTDPQTLAGVRTLLGAARSATDATRFDYNPGNTQQRRSQLSAACMTAVGSLMRLHTGTAATDAGMQQSARLLAGFVPSYGSATQKARDSYLWYYASQVLVHTGGPEWERWYRALVETLEAHQERSGPLAGSWNPTAPTPDRWGEWGGRVYVSALHLLALEVPWRHLPTSAERAAP